jgi:hypothetical protein
MKVNKTNSYFNTWYARERAVLVHHYFSSWVVGISTIGALFALYLTLIQTASGVASALDSLHANHFWSYIRDSISLPFSGKPSTSNGPTAGEDESKGCVLQCLKKLLKMIGVTKK